MKESTNFDETELTTYNTIEREASAEFKDRGSRFIGYSFPVKSIDEFKSNLELIKKEHPKATHHCFAYRIGADKNTFRSNDDGEPAGTAGKPILGQIDSRQLTDTLVVVVRYFGGTLLGVPGLIHAYRSAAAMVLQLTPVVQKAIELPYKLSFDYTTMNDIMQLIKTLGCSVYKQEMNLFCEMEVGIPKSKLTEALYRLSDIRNVEISELKPNPK